MLDHVDRVELKIALVRLGMKQYELADRLGVTEGKLSAFMRGRRRLPEHTLQQLQDILGLALAGVASED